MTGHYSTRGCYSVRFVLLLCALNGSAQLGSPMRQLPTRRFMRPLGAPAEDTVAVATVASVRHEEFSLCSNRTARVLYQHICMYMRYYLRWNNRT